MRILHIGYSDSGGAGRGMLNLHYALKSVGIDSKVLVASKTTLDDDIECIPPNYNYYSYSNNRFIRYIQKRIRKKSWCLNQLDRFVNVIKQIPPSASCYFTYPITHYDISQHPLLKNADIIHLHWIANFVDYPSFFQNVNKCIVWTLRDENPGLGGFHYETTRNQYEKYYNSIEKDFLKIKRDSLCGHNNINLVAMSDTMRAFCANNDILKHFPVWRIDNLVDLSQYNHINQRLAKQTLRLSESTFHILFVSVDLSDSRKNLELVYKALHLVPFAAELICVGNNSFFKNVPDDVICLNSINSERLMSIIYSAADVFITPATQESFGKTTIESLSCGTPVISSIAGIAPEVISSTNGVLLEDISIQDIAQAIIKVHDSKYDRESIRNKTLELFNPQRIVNQYLELYHELIS